MILPVTVVRGLCLRAMRFTRLVHVPSATIASNTPPEATIARPCRRMIFDLCESSASGTAILWRSASVIWIRSISRSLRLPSSTPRNAQSMYQSQATRRTIREKKSSHSSRLGIPGFASRGGGASCTFCRRRESSIDSPVSSSAKSGVVIGTSKGLSNSASSSKSVTIGPFCCRRASAASGVIPRPGILPTIGAMMRNNNFRWFACWFLRCERFRNERAKLSESRRDVIADLFNVRSNSFGFACRLLCGCASFCRSCVCLRSVCQSGCSGRCGSLGLFFGN